MEKKKDYQVPSIKIKNIDAESIMAAVSVGGNAGIGMGGGDGETPPTSGSAKSNSLDTEPSGNSIWSE